MWRIERSVKGGGRAVVNDRKSFLPNRMLLLEDDMKPAIPNTHKVYKPDNRANPASRASGLRLVFVRPTVNFMCTLIFQRWRIGMATA